MKEYTTIAEFGEASHVDKKSRFIGRAMPVSTEEDAIAFIKMLREEEPEASHHCYAYRLRENNMARYSDDGEPQGTAGLPMLDMLTKSDVIDLCVVVERWFGGTLLGTGGLVRAYTRAAREAVEVGGIAVMTPCVITTFDCHYKFKERVESLCQDMQGAIINLDYAENLSYKMSIPESLFDGFCSSIIELTLGASTAENIGFEFRPVKKEDIG